MHKALAGVTVVEFTAHLGSAYAAMLLAEQGARAIKIEPQDGDPARGTPHFHALNRSKQSIFLNFDSTEDLAKAHDLVSIADIILTGFTPARQRALGLDYPSVARINPAVLLLQMPPLGSRGPYAEMPGESDLVHAWGGIFASQSSRSGYPVAIPFPVAAYQSGVLGAAAAVAGLIARGNGGPGQEIEVSLLAGALSLQTGDFLRNPKIPTSRPGPHDPMGPYEVIYLYQGSDGGYLIIDCTSARFCQNLARAIGRPELFSDPRFKDAPWTIRSADKGALRSAIQEAFLARTRDEWIPILRAHDVPSAPVLTRGQFFDDPQVRHLGMRREVSDPTLGPTVQVGVPVTLTSTPGDIVGPAPALDKSNSALAALIKEARHRKETSHSAKRSKPEAVAGGPLCGIVVIDLSSYIAGSYGPMLLGQLGATVIKVENQEGDSLRLVSGFRGWNQNKRDLAVNLKTAEGREIVYDLVAKSDIVVENFRPGRTRNLGIDYPALAAINPKIIYMSVTGYGSSGPDYQRPGLDPLVQATSGSFAAIGGVGRTNGEYPDSPRQPIYMNVALADYGAATLSALGCLLALRMRQITGRGQHCETSLVQSVLALQAGEFIFYSGRPDLENSGGPESRGTSALHRAYQCQDDQWLYISVSDEEAWDELTSQSPAIPALTFAQARLEQAEGKLADALGRYFAAGPCQTFFDALRSRAILVSRVPHISQVFDDPQVTANELLTELQDSSVGTFAQIGHLAKFSNGLATLQPAPRLGEHSEQILAEFLGYDSNRIARLRASGIILQD